MEKYTVGLTEKEVKINRDKYGDNTLNKNRQNNNS